MKDALGDRMKDYYEDRTRIFLPRRTYTIIRVDGKAFHTYTRGLQRPFDDDMMADMDDTARFLCKQIQGAKFAFVQSDEISVLLTDFDQINTSAWFDGNIQKIASVSASLGTGWFNAMRHARSISPDTIAYFDARVFTVPHAVEVENYFIWRQQDCTRNSIQSVAQSMYSHRQLEGKNTSELQEMIFQKGINWNDYAPRYKRGRIARHVTAGERTEWIIQDVPVWTQERGELSALIPLHYADVRAN